MDGRGDGAPRRFRLLFVCTGNICRSPFARFHTRALLEMRLGPRWASWFDVASGGTGAVVGSEMHPLSRAQLGPLATHPDVAAFRARQLPARDVELADLVLTVSRSHRSAVLELEPRALRSTFTVREFARLLGSIDPADHAALPADPRERAHALVAAALGGARPGRAGRLRGRRDPGPDPGRGGRARRVRAPPARGGAAARRRHRRRRPVAGPPPSRAASGRTPASTPAWHPAGPARRRRCPGARSVLRRARRPVPCRPVRVLVACHPGDRRRTGPPWADLPVSPPACPRCCRRARGCRVRPGRWTRSHPIPSRPDRPRTAPRAAGTTGTAGRRRAGRVAGPGGPGRVIPGRRRRAGPGGSTTAARLARRRRGPRRRRSGRREPREHRRR